MGASEASNARADDADARHLNSAIAFRSVWTTPHASGRPTASQASASLIASIIGVRSLGFIRSTRYAVAGWMPAFCCRGRVRSW